MQRDYRELLCLSWQANADAWTAAVREQRIESRRLVTDAAILALAVYGLLAPSRLIDNPPVMMAVACIVGAWFMRIWLVAGRGELNDDPVMFAVKDKVSLACLVVVAAFLAAESTRPIWSQWF